ncbi:MAG: ABC transporter permease, partial [Vicinamibacteria bacterium]
MNPLAAVVRKEFIHIRREPRLAAFIVGFPAVFVLLFGYALRLQIENVPLAMFDEDRSALSLLVKDQIVSEGSFDLTEVSSLEEARRRLDSGEARVAMHIPADFSAILFDGKQATIHLLVDATMPTVAVGVENDASVVTENEFTGQLLFTPPDEPEPLLADPPVRLEKTFLYNPDLRDVYYFLPGIIGILILQVGIMLTSVAIVREKENRTLEQLLVTPIKRWELIIGKIIPY